MASGKNAKKSRSSAVPVVRARQGLPWLTILAVVIVLGLVAAIFTFVYSKQHTRSQAAAAETAEQTKLAPWAPTASNMDPSTKIPGIYVGASTNNGSTITYPKYKAALHVTSKQRVDYDRFPPVGGPHDAEWAACNGVVYTQAVRDENMVHTLEHGAIWIAYNPTTIAAGDLDKLKAMVVGKTYLSLSPYPTLDQPISVQSWAHQLKVTSAADERIPEFIRALQENPYTTPEVNGSCDQPGFADSPPAFDPSPRGSDGVPLDGSGLAAASDEPGLQAADTSGETAGSGASGSVAPGAGEAAPSSIPAAALSSSP